MTTTIQPLTNVVSTTGVTSSQDGVIPIASLFSSSDLGPTPKKSPTSFTPMKRAATFHNIEQDREQTTT